MTRPIFILGFSAHSVVVSLPSAREGWDSALAMERAQSAKSVMDASAAFELACYLAMVNRALSWQQGTGSLPKRHKEPYADAVPEWLQDFLIAEKSA